MRKSPNIKPLFFVITAAVLLSFTAKSYGRAVIYISSTQVEPVAVGEQMHLNIQIVGGIEVAGYELTVGFDPTSLRYVKSANADYLPAGAFAVPPLISDNSVYIASTSPAGSAPTSDGTLATLTFEVIAAKNSDIKLMDVLLSDTAGMRLLSTSQNGRIVTTELPVIWDVNEDGRVNILDLTLVASNINANDPATPRVDVNRDGNVNILDLVLVAQNLDAGGGNNPEVRVKLVIPTFPSLDIEVDNRQVVMLQGRLNTDRTLVAAYDYLLRGAVFVEGGATLSIEPGVHIFGEQATNGTLIIAKGAKIMADGTADAPIVMSSDAAIGSRARGQWGGLIINGNAPTNQGVTFGEGDTGAFGGNDPNDSSGILRYVRIEYAGIELSPDNELNGIAFQGVGAGTIVEYVQVHMSQDDGIEMFGGTVNLKYVLVTGARDDSFDWTDGWTGKGQFWVAQQYGDDADNGFEIDNSSKNNEASPRSAATIYNVTLVGDPSGRESDNGMLIRRGAAGTYANFIVTGFNKIGLDIDGKSSIAQAEGGDLVVKNSIFFENGKGNFGDERNDDGFDEATFAAVNENKETDPGLVAPFNKEAPDFTPRAGTVSPAAPPNDGFFEQVNFIGGVSPSNNWLSGWTTSDQN